MARKTVRPTAPAICPVCGDDVPRGALACPECGADHESGWRHGAADGADLPDEEFDYDEFVKEEFGSRVKPAHLRPMWWVTAIVLILLTVLLFLLTLK